MGEHAFSPSLWREAGGGGGSREAESGRYILNKQKKKQKKWRDAGEISSLIKQEGITGRMAGKTAQCLRAFTALLEDWNSDPRTHKFL